MSYLGTIDAKPYLPRGKRSRVPAGVEVGASAHDDGGAVTVRLTYTPTINPNAERRTQALTLKPHAATMLGRRLIAWAGWVEGHKGERRVTGRAKGLDEQRARLVQASTLLEAIGSELIGVEQDTPPHWQHAPAWPGEAITAARAKVLAAIDEIAAAIGRATDELDAAAKGEGGAA